MTDDTRLTILSVSLPLPPTPGMCPKAFEPLTLRQNPRRRAVRLKLKSFGGSSSAAAQLSFSFSGSTAILKARADDMDSAECMRLLGELKSVETATCERESVDVTSGSGSYIIQLDEYPLFPHENNIFNHTGNPHLSAFRCNVTATNQGVSSSGAEFEDEDDDDGSTRPLPVCSIEDVVADNLPGYYECSNHGSCSRADGVCSCERGFHGPACDDTRDSSVRFRLEDPLSFYTANLNPTHHPLTSRRTRSCTATMGRFSRAR